MNVLVLTQNELIVELNKNIDKNNISYAISYVDGKYILDQISFSAIYIDEVEKFTHKSGLFLDPKEKLSLTYWTSSKDNCLEEIVDYDLYIWKYHYVFSLFYEWDKK